MDDYLNLGGNSGVVAYEIAADSIRVQFKDGWVYTYTAASAGSDNLEMMKQLARGGLGLNAYIDRNARTGYASKEAPAPQTHPVFAVFRTAGPAWDKNLPMRSQANWDEHARFMDELTAQGFILMGGPLGGDDGHEVLMAIQADSEQKVREVLAGDVWEPAGILVTSQVRPWTVLLDARKP